MYPRNIPPCNYMSEARAEVPEKHPGIEDWVFSPIVVFLSFFFFLFFLFFTFLTDQI